MKKNVSSLIGIQHMNNNVFKIRLSKSKIISGLSSIILSVFFLYAGIYVLHYKNYFEWVLKDDNVLKNYINLIVWGLPIFELILSLVLLITRTRFLGFYLSFFLLLGITLVIFILQHFFASGPCVCLGIFPTLSWLQQTFINIGFILLSISGACFTSVSKK